jgi:oligopeptide/dipeptide ABC transporter ATP-binding protein
MMVIGCGAGLHWAELMSDIQPIIQLRGISRSFGSGKRRSVVLEDVDLTVNCGESVAIVGESGAGKTTLLRVLLGLLPPSQGRYLFDGADLSSLLPRERRQWRRDVQAVFQNPFSSLNPRLRIDVQVTEPLEMISGPDSFDRRRRACESLEMVGLPAAFASRYPHELSGGQRQRVVIARALSSAPRVVVFDEPLSALDLSVKAQIIALLRRLRQKLNLTCVFVTHDLATIPSLCERVYVMYKGEIVEALSTAKLLSGPDHPYTRLLLASVPTLERRGQLGQLTRFAKPPVLESALLNSAGCHFAPRCVHAQSICVEAPPKLQVISDGWNSRCHFFGEVKPVSSGNLVRHAS